MGLGMLNPARETRGGSPGIGKPQKKCKWPINVKRRSISREPEKGKNSTDGYFPPIRLANVLDNDNMELRGRHRLPSF